MKFQRIQEFHRGFHVCLRGVQENFREFKGSLVMDW